jgi:hypothetical protein
MKPIPKHLFESVSGFNRNGIDVARKCVEIESVMYRKAGNKDAADALRDVAKALKKISKGTATPAVAFDWPSEA